MTDNANSDKSESENNSNGRIQSGFKTLGYKIKTWFQRRLNRKPAYLVTRHGVVVRYFNFSDTDTLPFDKETYRDTQIFLGKWANPWYVDIDELEDKYPNFTEQEITSIDDIFGTEYLYPSQKWKTLANTKALQQMFTGRSIDTKQIQRLLYAVIGLLVLLGAFLVFGG